MASAESLWVARSRSAARFLKVCSTREMMFSSLGSRSLLKTISSALSSCGRGTHFLDFMRLGLMSVNMARRAPLLRIAAL